MPSHRLRLPLGVAALLLSLEAAAVATSVNLSVSSGGQRVPIQTVTLSLGTEQSVVVSEDDDRDKGLTINNLEEGAQYSYTAIDNQSRNFRGSFKVPSGGGAVTSEALPVGATSVFTSGAGGHIQGRVTLADGSALPGATVTITRPGLAAFTTVTDVDGRFHFRNLAPGDYVVRGSLAGFAPFQRSDISIGAGEQVTLDSRMSLLADKEEIVVTTGTAIADDAGDGIAGSRTRTRPESLPTARDPGSILLLLPRVDTPAGGARDGEGAGGDAGSADSAAGSDGWTIDGVAISDPAVLGVSPTYYDFGEIEESQVSTGGVDTAFFGRSLIQLVTRRGNRIYEGSSRSVFTNDSLQATTIDDPIIDARTVIDTTDHYPIFDAETVAEIAGSLKDEQVTKPLVRDRLWFFQSNGLGGFRGEDGRPEHRVNANINSGYGSLDSLAEQIRDLPSIASDVGGPMAAGDMLTRTSDGMPSVSGDVGGPVTDAGDMVNLNHPKVIAHHNNKVSLRPGSSEIPLSELAGDWLGYDSPSLGPMTIGPVASLPPVNLEGYLLFNTSEPRIDFRFPVEDLPKTIDALGGSFLFNTGGTDIEFRFPVESTRASHASASWKGFRIDPTPGFIGGPVAFPVDQANLALGGVGYGRYAYQQPDTGPTMTMVRFPSDLTLERSARGFGDGEAADLSRAGESSGPHPAWFHTGSWETILLTGTIQARVASTGPTWLDARTLILADDALRTAPEDATGPGQLGALRDTVGGEPDSSCGPLFSESGGTRSDGWMMLIAEATENGPRRRIVLLPSAERSTWVELDAGGGIVGSGQGLRYDAINRLLWLSGGTTPLERQPVYTVDLSAAAVGWLTAGEDGPRLCGAPGSITQTRATENVATVSPTACRGLGSVVPERVLTLSLEDPSLLTGYGLPCRPELPPMASNGIRGRLSLNDPEQPYHPLFNPVIVACDCGVLQ